jgi:hypothetical protein
VLFEFGEEMFERKTIHINLEEIKKTPKRIFEEPTNDGDLSEEESADFTVVSVSTSTILSGKSFSNKSKVKKKKSQSEGLGIG